MKILYLTFYFEPDLSAGSFRNTPLAKKLASLVQKDAVVHVITTQPNRYHSFKESAPTHEETGNLIIDRVKLPGHKNGFIDQIISFQAYYRGVRKIIRREKYDLVFASSSRLFTAYLGKLAAEKNDCPLYLDMRDLLSENMAEIIKNSIARWSILKVLRYVENITFKRAVHINMVSEGFRDSFIRYKQATFSFYPNGIDDEFLRIVRNKNLPEWPKVITYAGNIGEGQGLENIIPQVAEMLGDKFLFRVIGDGGKREELRKRLEAMKISNVELLKPVKRDMLAVHYRQSHYLFLHLNDYKAFEKVLPSKVFEYGATDIPVIAGVNGYARKFIQGYIENAFVFDPCNSQQLYTYLTKHPYRLENRNDFVDKFHRKNITRKIADSISVYLK